MIQLKNWLDGNRISSECNKPFLYFRFDLEALDLDLSWEELTKILHHRLLTKMFKYFKNPYSLILILWESLQIYWEQRVWWTCKINDYLKDFYGLLHRKELIITGLAFANWLKWLFVERLEENEPFETVSIRKRLKNDMDLDQFVLDFCSKTW